MVLKVEFLNGGFDCDIGECSFFLPSNRKSCFFLFFENSVKNSMDAYSDKKDPNTTLKCHFVIV